MTCAVRSPNLHSTRDSFYIVNPLFDLFFICGGNVLLLLSLSLASPAIQEATPIIIFFGTYMLAQPHLGASLARLYESSESILSRPFLSMIIPVVLIGTTVQALPNLSGHINILSLVYLLFIGHHVLAQSYGIFLVYCARSNVNLSANERLLLKAILHSSVATAIVAQFTTDFHNRLSLSGTAGSNALLPFLPLPVFIFTSTVLVILSLAFFCFQMNRFYSGQRVVPFAAILTISTAILLLIVAFSVGPTLWTFTPAFYHGSQYLAITMAHRFKMKEQSTSVISFLANEYNTYLGIGLALALGVPLMLYSLRVVPDITQGMQLLFLLVSLHHFAVDSRIWKTSSGFKHKLGMEAQAA